jgi:hypothetical protein
VNVPIERTMKFYMRVGFAGYFLQYADRTMVTF